jgi:hypothetical protein
VLELGPLRIEIGLAPLRIDVRRAGRRLLLAVSVWACEGEVRDRFVRPRRGRRPLHATLWGEPRGGRALARLAGGALIRWRRGRWSARGRTEVTFEER